MGTSFAMGGCLGITIGTCMATIQAGADYAAGRKMNITQHMKATSRLTISSGVMFGVFLGASAIFRGC